MGIDSLVSTVTVGEFQTDTVVASCSSGFHQCHRLTPDWARYMGAKHESMVLISLMQKCYSTTSVESRPLKLRGTGLDPQILRLDPSHSSRRRQELPRNDPPRSFPVQWARI